jgi:hypothetical protein
MKFSTLTGALAVALLSATSASARDVHVDGYYRKNGTYVQPHTRTAPDSNPYNNYSTRGNMNPYNGKEGTVDPYRNNSYGSGRSNSFGNNSWNNDNNDGYGN